MSRERIAFKLMQLQGRLRSASDPKVTMVLRQQIDGLLRRSGGPRPDDASIAPREATPIAGRKI